MYNQGAVQDLCCGEKYTLGDAMKLKTRVREYLSTFSPRAVLLLLIGLVPLYAALGFLLAVRLLPGGAFGYDVLWLHTRFAFWVDSFGLSFLLLIAGAVILDYAERRDPR